MRKKALLILTLIAALILGSPPAEAQRKPMEGLNFEVAQKQSYWYSLCNVAHLTMFSGLGEPIPSGAMIGFWDWLRGGGIRNIERLPKMNMISAVYAGGSPGFVRPVDRANPASMGWDESAMDKSLLPAAQAFTIIKVLAKNFHRDYHETAFNQTVAIAMYPQAQAMARNLAEKLLNDQGLFIALDLNGKALLPRPLDQIAALWAFADLALIASDPDLPPYRNAKIARWAEGMANKAFRATLSLPLTTVSDRSLAIEAYGRFAAATEDKDLRGRAIKLVRMQAEEISRAAKRNITELALLVYGLIEASRITGNKEWSSEALRIFDKDMEALWDEKAGVYANTAKAGRYVYTPLDVGAVLAALGGVRWFAIPPYENPDASGPALTERRYARFFESAVVLSGMQLAADLPLVENLYLKREPPGHFAHPSLPRVESAGEGFGRAPVYASEVAYENGTWRVTNPNFDTASAMFLANMSVLFNRSQLDSFIPIERLLARLIQEKR